ncbi:lytic transglycosylase domain-containing protein [Alkalihalobacillus sp. AL-G]|uniref:lytic transglycosylase domain-containing protein n=1 Tax=Alkalihalobacillus sp. AL-G TaxID=2926399 RepID=UPI00272B2ACA|nr:transglycosylase SLT domain-containing protein [Alkalihalobacillus sp. AL-G]WLD92096.1 transglycosylase SLT domain-containing protein [Alkalihalobacillus sp. AL-G]
MWLKANKQTFTIGGLLIGMITVILYMYYENSELKSQLVQEKQEKQMVAAEQDYKQMIAYYKQKGQRNEPIANGYEVLKKSKVLSDQFEKQSNGRFKKAWGKFLVRESVRKGIDPYIVYELLRVETGNTFDPNIVGPETKYGRAYGMAQFMKNTAPWIAEMADLPYSEEKLFDPYYSIQLAIVYLDYLHAKYKDWDKVLTAYNRGMYGMETYIQEKGHAKSWYAKEIREKAKEQEMIAVAN